MDALPPATRSSLDPKGSQAGSQSRSAARASQYLMACYPSAERQRPNILSFFMIGLQVRRVERGHAALECWAVLVSGCCGAGSCLLLKGPASAPTNS